MEDFETSLKPLIEVDADGTVGIKNLNDPSVQKLVSEFISYALNFGRMRSRKARTELEDYNMGNDDLSLIQ